MTRTEENYPSTLIRIPVYSFRKIPSPFEEKDLNSYVAIVRVTDIPEALEEWRKGLNPRDPKLASVVANKIKDSLLDAPESFLFRNRGITIMADRIRYDNKSNTVEIVMTTKSRHGLLDGGHTFRVIRDFTENLEDEDMNSVNGYVRIEMLEGFKDQEEAVAIVESRNTSTQIKEQSLEELRKHYDQIKEVLKDTLYAGRIAYKEYEMMEGSDDPKDIDIKDLLSYLVCFDVEEFDSNKHPLKAYSSKSATVDHFKKNHERMAKYIPLLPSILELRDTIYLGLPKAYNQEGGKFGKLTGVTEVTGTRMKKERLPFLSQESSYRIPSGFIYPILAAFRGAIDCHDEKCSWKTDPIKLFEELKSDLATRVGDQAKELRNPNKLGKDLATWRMCYDRVATEILRRNI